MMMHLSKFTESHIDWCFVCYVLVIYGVMDAVSRFEVSRLRGCAFNGKFCQSIGHFVVQKLNYSLKWFKAYRLDWKVQTDFGKFLELKTSARLWWFF